MDRRKHERALAILRSLKQNALIEVEYIDNHSIKDIITRAEALKQTREEPLTATTSGYYQAYDRNYLWLSADKIEEEEDRGQFNVILTKYVVRVTRLKRK